nr:DegV family protein [uncultured Dysosmobacter sp.]
MIKITTDSTCDLPRSLLEQHDITVIPLGIVKAGRLYQDGVDIRIEDIAAHVDAGGDITTTNAVNIADYEDVFRRMTERYDAVIHINIGMQFSSCHQNAKLAAEEVPEVYVVDSSNLTVGHGMLVLAAAEAAEAGKSVSEILDLVEDMIPRVETSFVLDRLDYMKKGGRCSAVTALGANLLKLHPCVEVIGGKMSVTKKYRGSMEKVVGDYVRERLTGRTDIDTRRIFLVDTCRTPGLREAAKASLEADGCFQEIIESKAGCTIFCHCGPDTLGIIFLRK